MERFVPPNPNEYMYDTQDWNSWTTLSDDDSSGYDPVLVSGFSIHQYTTTDSDPTEKFNKNYDYDYREINGIYKPMTKPGNGDKEIIYVKDDKKSYIRQTLINLSKRNKITNLPEESGYPQHSVWAIYNTLSSEKKKYKIIAYFYPTASTTIQEPLIDSWVLILRCNDRATHRAERWDTRKVPKVNAISYPANIIETKEKVIESKKWRAEHPILTAFGRVPEEYRDKGGRKTKQSTKKNKRKTRKTKKNKITK